LIANGVAIVSKGTDITEIEIKTDKFPKENTNLFYKTYLRSLDDNWDQIISEDIKKGLTIKGGEYYDSLPKNDYAEFLHFEKDEKRKDVYFLDLKYEASTDREIFTGYTKNGKWIGHVKNKIKPGSGVVRLNLKIKEFPKVGESIVFRPQMRPINSTWREATFGTRIILINDKEKGIFVKANSNDKKLPKKDFVSIDSSEKSLSLSESNELEIKYGAMQRRKIEIIINDAKGNWLGGSNTIVKEGTGVVFLDIKLTNQPKDKGFADIILHISPVETAWKKGMGRDRKKFKFIN